ncbi:PEPxxWA-CTERM sorting domain-containing protein [Thermaurantiacus sp.]
MNKFFGAGLVAGAMLLYSGVAHASLHVTKAGFFNSATVSLAGPGPGNGNQTAANFRLQGTFHWGGTFDVYAFCVDLANSIALGSNSLADVNYKYDLGTLTMAPGTMTLLTAGQLQQMKGLAALGFQLLNDGDPDLGVKIPAIQSAIWSIEYGKTATSSNPTIQGWINSYIALAPSLTGKNVSYIYSLDTPTRQGLFISYVPEPGTWTMLIAGFGLVGYAARRKNGSRPATVTA